MSSVEQLPNRRVGYEPLRKLPHHRRVRLAVGLLNPYLLLDMKPRTKYAKQMLAIQELGASDFVSGKPITAFPDRNNLPGIMKLLTDRARAAYEIGWRSAKEARLNP